MKVTKRGVVILVILPLAATGLFIGAIPLALNVSSTNGASLLGAGLLAIAGWISYVKVLQE